MTRPRNHSQLKTVAVALPALLAGCFWQARINRLTVTPAEVCPDDPVEATWSAEGRSVRLRQDPALSLGAPRTQREGIQGLSGNRDFDVVLEAQGRGAISQRRYVHVVTEHWTFVLSAPPQCRDGKVRVDVDFHVSDPQIDARMQVTSVEARSDRALTITHGGLPPVTVTKGSMTIFRGTPLAGLWTLTAPLHPGESCVAGSPSALLAPAVIVAGTCGGISSQAQRYSGLEGAPRCGYLGQPCCAGNSCEGHYRCAGEGRGCVDPQRPSAITTGTRCNQRPATAQSRTFVVAIRDQFGCGEMLAVLADSREEANACARKSVGGATTIQDGSARQFDYCRDGRTRIHVVAFSEQDARACARHHWPTGRLGVGFCG
jgi:hypothetical protein